MRIVFVFKEVSDESDVEVRMYEGEKEVVQKITEENFKTVEEFVNLMMKIFYKAWNIEKKDEYTTMTEVVLPEMRINTEKIVSKSAKYKKIMMSNSVDRWTPKFEHLCSMCLKKNRCKVGILIHSGKHDSVIRKIIGDDMDSTKCEVHLVVPSCKDFEGV
ncbi:MAG: hypothetical protein ACTSPB_03495 [Candidatus Thorarchaeota archaeon]